MKSRFKTPSLKSLCAVGMGLLLSASAGIAQNDWEGFYNSGNFTAAARGGVLHFSDNSSIAVGEATTLNGTVDIYVTHQPGNECGNFDWQYTYHIGGNDIGRKIRRTSDGGYIIVGSTQNTGTGCNADDIFLMKITSLGAVSWTRTYGGPGIEEGYDVQELAGGDFIVAGSITSTGAGLRDGYLLRTNSLGVPIWGQTYGSANHELFISVTVAANGELIASGSYSNSSSTVVDIILARINATTGVPVFYSTYATASNEVAWRAIELAGGNIALCGNTRAFGGNSEGLIMLTNSAGTFISGHYYGGGINNGWDEFLDITQLSGGDLMVTGLFHMPSGGYGGYDVYVGRVNSVTLAPVAQFLFGGARDDQGWAITKSGSGNPDGWMVAGLSGGYGTLYPQRMYIISRPNMTLRDCQSVAINPVHGSAPLSRVTSTPSRFSYTLNCAVTVSRSSTGGYQAGCGDCGFSKPGTPGVEMEGISEYRGPDFSARIAPGIDSSSLLVSSVDENAGGSAAVYPNPVKNGASFTLALPAIAGSIEITVTDMAGKVIHTGTVSGTEASIDTKGWAGGVYAIRLSQDGRVSTRQIVVTD